MANIMKKNNGNKESAELRNGPWTLEEDTLLTNYITLNGEGRWNLLANSSGLKRTGKSCRLRWMNYLKPDIKRGNLTPQEQLLILELHSILGNKWSKIAQNLPGRTDNEIKNYWRTRVQKQARRLNIDSSSHKFLEVVRSFWAPRLTHKMKDYSNISTRVAPPHFCLPNNDFIHHDSGFMNMDCSNSVSQELKKVSQFRDLSSLETTGSICLEGSRGSSSQCVSEDYSYLACLEDKYLVASMGNSDILPLQNSHVADLTYEEDVTQDPVWNMDNIWQFKDYSRF